MPAIKSQVATDNQMKQQTLLLSDADGGNTQNANVIIKLGKMTLNVKAAN